MVPNACCIAKVNRLTKAFYFPSSSENSQQHNWKCKFHSLFPNVMCISVVPQLNKCLKFEAIRGVRLIQGFVFKKGYKRPVPVLLFREWLTISSNLFKLSSFIFHKLIVTKVPRALFKYLHLIAYYKTSLLKSLKF